MATKYETLVNQIASTEVKADNAAEVAAQFITVIGCVGSRDDLDALVEMPQYGTLEVIAPEEHSKVEEAWLEKNHEFESPAKAEKPAKEPKAAKEEKPAKGKKEKTEKTPKKEPAKKEPAKKEPAKKVAKPAGHTEGHLSGESPKAVAWVEFMKGEVKAKARSCTWKAMLIDMDISQPYSHKLRQARPDIHELAEKWRALEGPEGAAPVKAKAPAKGAADKKTAKQKKVEEANKARIKKATEKKNGMKKRGRPAKK